MSVMHEKAVKIGLTRAWNGSRFDWVGTNGIGSA